MFMGDEADATYADGTLERYARCGSEQCDFMPIQPPGDVLFWQLDRCGDFGHGFLLGQASNEYDQYARDDQCDKDGGYTDQGKCRALC